jgi:hypothetical protein
MGAKHFERERRERGVRERETDTDTGLRLETFMGRCEEQEGEAHEEFPSQPVLRKLDFHCAHTLEPTFVMIAEGLF